MTRQISIDIPQGVNLEALRAELRAVVGDMVAGVSRSPGGIAVVVEDSAPPDIANQFDAVIAAHDPAQLTLEQQAQADADAARAELLAVLDATLTLYDNALGDWDNLTLAQLKALQKRQIQVQQFLLRYLRRGLNL